MGGYYGIKRKKENHRQKAFGKTGRNPGAAVQESRRSTPRSGCCRWAKRTRVCAASGSSPDEARGPRVAGAGQIRGRRGIIGGYWGGYSLLSSRPTPRALPGKVENLTPPANGKNAPDGAPPAAPVQPDQVQPDQCQRQQPGTGTGSRPPPPTICTGTPPAQQIAPPVQTEGQSSSAPRAAALAFFFCPAFTPTACPACRISSPERAGRCAAVAPMTTPAHRSRSRSHRLPPAPGRISAASAAPDDHASSRPPPTMTTHQRQPCPICTAPTACQPCQTSQRQRQPPAGRTSPPAPHTCRCLHRCRLTDDPPRSTPQNGHFAPPPEGSDSPPNGIEL